MRPKYKTGKVARFKRHLVEAKGTNWHIAPEPHDFWGLKHYEKAIAAVDAKLMNARYIYL